MTRVVIGIDPSKTATGHAVLEGDGVTRPIVHVLGHWPFTVDKKAKDPWAKAGASCRAARALADLWSDDDVTWAVEEMPDKMGAGDHATHKSGGAVGWAQGVATAAALEVGHQVVMVPVNDWRATMRELHDRWGGGSLDRASAPKRPSRAPGVSHMSHDPAPGWIVINYKCGHAVRVGRVAVKHHPRCHKCSPRPATAKDAKKDATKARSCAFVARWWPKAYATLVAKARKTAQATTPDHRLKGVADACEAVCIACHHLAQGPA